MHVLWVNPDVTFNLQNLTVTNGLASDEHDGGGIWVAGANGHIATVNISHVTFNDNINTVAGGVNVGVGVFVEVGVNVGVSVADGVNVGNGVEV